MEMQQSKNIKQKKLSNKYFLLSLLSIVCLALNSCMFRNGTYYEYLTEPPIITTDKRLAMQKLSITTKKLNDTTYYYCTEGRFYQTKDYEKAKKGYITAIMNLKYGKSIGNFVLLDGFGDTISIDYRDRNNLDSLRISYYGNKQIKFYQELKNGRNNGIAKYYYPNGNLRQISHWIENVEQGESVFYYQNGNIESKGNNKNGVKNGLWVYFNEHGDTIKTENY